MFNITIPGTGQLKITHMILDFNGTIAFNGKLIEGVSTLISKLSEKIEISVVTADTFGTARQELLELECSIKLLDPDNQDIQKLNYLRTLGSGNTVCIGNGKNDSKMLADCSLGIAVIGNEGAHKDTVLSADIVCPSILSALELFIHPNRLLATLRN